MNIWLFLFVALVVAVGWKKAIVTAIQAYAIGLAIGIGFIFILLLLAVGVK